MRTITKGAECPELRNWKRSNLSSPQNIHYDHLGAAQREPMLDTLIKEQGGLCAYTMKSIHRIGEAWQAHIEHILPRSKYPDRSVDWNNMLACAPKGNADYGAKLKDKYDPGVDLFVSPTTGGVSAQFHFRENGEVDGLTDAAKVTLSEKVLHLNHPHLINDRKSKIRGAMNQKPTAAQARQRAQSLRQRDTHGLLEPYCEAVAQVLEAYANRLENRAHRMAGTRRR